MSNALLVHRRLLERWRSAMDLVGPGPLEPHYQDCLKAVEDLPVQGLWADLGSGAGFPGFILAACHPEARVHLVERRQKRAAFLETVVAEAGLKNAEVKMVDTDSLSGPYEGLISRAYRPPVDILPQAARLLAPGGTLVLMLAAEPPPSSPHFQVFHVKHYEVEGKPRQVVSMKMNQ